MIRRDLFKGALAIPALRASVDRPPATPEFPKSPGLTRYVADFIVNTKYTDIPNDVLELGKKSILDGFGLALAGSVSVMGPLLRRYLETLGSGEGKASIIGTGMKAPARFASFVNGVSIHADDFDDTQLSAARDRIYGLLTHPTVPVLPPAFALCESAPGSGKDLMLAYHLGVEVECKIAEAISPRHYGDGFHTTGTCGSFGSAAACARLRGLNALQTRYAIGIAATEGGGFRNNFGSMTKPFHAGRAAENGTVAADLAALGWTASENILEAPLGFFQAEGGGYDPLKNGKVISGRADSAKGSPSNPMTYDEVADKFRGCAEFAKWPGDKAEAVIASVRSLESAPDMSKLTAALTKEAGAR